MISSFIAETFAISDNYCVWNESNIIENLRKSNKKRKNVVTTMVTRMVTMINLGYNRSN